MSDVVPKCRAQLIDAAKKASLALKTPFISVAMYASVSGPVLGELTSTPGSPYFGANFRFTPEFDAELGRAWIEGIAELGMQMPLIDDTEPMTKRLTGMPSADSMARSIHDERTMHTNGRRDGHLTRPVRRIWRAIVKKIKPLT